MKSSLPPGAEIETAHVRPPVAAVQDAEVDERSTFAVNDVTPEPWMLPAICMPCVDGETYFGTRLLLDVVVSGIWIERATEPCDCAERETGDEPPPEQAPSARMQSKRSEGAFHAKGVPYQWMMTIVVAPGLGVTVGIGPGDGAGSVPTPRRTTITLVFAVKKPVIEVVAPAVPS